MFYYRSATVTPHTVFFRWAPSGRIVTVLYTHGARLLFRGNGYCRSHDQVCGHQHKITALHQGCSEKQEARSHTQNPMKQAPCPPPLRHAQRPPVLKVSRGSKPTAPTQMSPALRLLSRRCQQQLLETADAVLHVPNRSLRLGFLITHFGGQKEKPE